MHTFMNVLASQGRETVEVPILISTKKEIRKIFLVHFRIHETLPAITGFLNSKVEADSSCSSVPQELIL